MEQKAAARRRREALETAERRATRRRRRLVQLALVTVAALSLVATTIYVTRSDDKRRPATRSEVAARFAGVPQDGIALGAATAPVTLVEFADLQCPFCAVYARDVLPTVVERYVRPGKLRLELNVLTFLGEDSVRAGRVAAAAAQQGRLWSFSDAFFGAQGTENTGYATDDFLRDIGTAAGLDVETALDRRDDPAVDRLLADAQDAADRLGVSSTPSFFIRRGDGEPRAVEPSDLTPEAFTAALDEALAAR
jgi:protein-disulfide isomerase